MNQSPVSRSAFLLAAGLLMTAASVSSIAAEPPAAQGAAAPAPPATSAGPSADAWAAMNAHMALMHDQMAKLNATTDPKLRAGLLDQHLKTMQETMKLMMGNDMGCPMAAGGAPGMNGRGGPMMNGGGMPMHGGMMGGGARGGGMMGNGMMGGGMMGNGNMMQLMLEQMAQHQNALQNPGR